MSRDRNEQPGEEQDMEYPGYPHYPAKEDITTPGNNNGKLTVNEDYLAPSAARNIPGQNTMPPTPTDGIDDTATLPVAEEEVLTQNPADVTDEDDVKIVMGTEADVTEDDLRLLDSFDGNMGLDDVDEDGEALNESSDDLIHTGEDLDVPGSEADDANESIGEEDEENNYYSLDKNSDDNTEGIP